MAERPAKTFRSGDALFAFDADLTIVSWNRAAEALTGVSAEAAVGRHCWEVLGGHDECGNLSATRGARPRASPAKAGRSPAKSCSSRRGRASGGSQCPRSRSTRVTVRSSFTSWCPTARTGPGVRACLAHASAAAGARASRRRRPSQSDRDPSRARRGYRPEPHPGDPRRARDSLPARGDREGPSPAAHHVAGSALRVFAQSPHARLRAKRKPTPERPG